jgi:hypothetical protein
VSNCLVSEEIETVEVFSAPAIMEHPFAPVLAQGPITRETVLRFESALAAHGVATDTTLNADDLTSHHLAPGMYCRELFIPAGACLTGKIHRTSHINIIAQGDISVLTEHGVRRFKAPCVLVSSAGIKRVGFAHADTTWITVHANPADETDLDQLEAACIAPNFEALGTDLKVLEDRA